MESVVHELHRTGGANTPLMLHDHSGFLAIVSRRACIRHVRPTSRSEVRDILVYVIFQLMPI